MNRNQNKYDRHTRAYSPQRADEYINPLAILNVHALRLFRLTPESHLLPPRHYGFYLLNTVTG